jgi:hypothetical protein
MPKWIREKSDAKQEAHENTTREESVESKVDRIVFGALAKVEVNDKQHPLLCSFKKSKDDNLIARHILDGLLTKIYGLLGSTHQQYYFINVPNHDVGA